MSVVVTYWTDVMFYEERECQPNGTMNSMMKQSQWKERPSKDRVKVSLLVRPNSKRRSSRVPNLKQLSLTLEQT